MNFSRFARYLLALLVSAALVAPTAYAYDKDKDKDKGKAKHGDKHKGKDASTGQKPPSTGEKHSSTGHKPRSTGGHDRDDDDDDDRGNGGMRFRGMDRNGDGRISRREWRGNDNSFRNHDCNRDGVLSGNEVRPGGDCSVLPPSTGNPPRNPPSTGPRNPPSTTQRERSARFRELDVNRDGHVAWEEWSGGTRSDFEVFDLNRDGRLSFDEFVNRR